MQLRRSAADSVLPLADIYWMQNTLNDEGKLNRELKTDFKTCIVWLLRVKTQ